MDSTTPRAGAPKLHESVESKLRTLIYGMNTDSQLLICQKKISGGDLAIEPACWAKQYLQD